MVLVIYGNASLPGHPSPTIFLWFPSNPQRFPEGIPYHFLSFPPDVGGFCECWSLVSIIFWWLLIVLVVLAVFFNCSFFFVVLVIYGNASGAPTPYHFPVVSIKSTTVPRRYPLPFPFISTRFWWFLLILVVLVVFNDF